MRPGATTVDTSEVHQTILKDHAFIRELLDEIEEERKPPPTRLISAAASVA